MVKFVVGDVVAVPFPFSDLSGKKLRPAVILAIAEQNDLILCQITSRSHGGNYELKLTQYEFETGGLPLISYIRPTKLFTAEESIIQKHKGRLTSQTKAALSQTVRALF